MAASGPGRDRRRCDRCPRRLPPITIALCGSPSSDSINEDLLRHVMSQVNRPVEFVSVRNIDAPFYSADVEKADGHPADIVALKARIAAADGLILASPEFNGGMPAMLKNTIDWLSRVGRPILPGPLLLLSTSPGGRGGQTNLGVLAERAGRWGATVTGTFSLPSFHKTFDRQARTLVDPEDQARLDAAIATFEAALPS